MAKTPARFDLLRGLALRRLQQRRDLNPEEWAKAVEEARREGYRLHRFAGLVVQLRDYSLSSDDEE